LLRKWEKEIRTLKENKNMMGRQRHVGSNVFL
jgi:hypothetical protein